MSFLRNKYFKFSLAAISYTLWVIWVGSYWLLIGLAIIFDIYITKKVNWSFWKKRKGKNSSVIEWLDALIFAVIAVTFINIFFFQNFKIPTGSEEKTLLIGDHLFVSKVSYGPRIPMTPLSFPFTQHTLPIVHSKSYLNWIKWPYKRLKGFGSVKNDNAVVFNFPAGDTVALEQQTRSYYSIVREVAENLRQNDLKAGNFPQSPEVYANLGRERVKQNYTIVVRPVDKEDNYIKRCVGIPGDTLLIVNGQVFINGKKQKHYSGMQSNYFIYTNGTRLNPRTLERMDIYKSDVYTIGLTEYMITLTEANAKRIGQFKNVIKIEKIINPAGQYDYTIFPHDSRYPWNKDNFGPLWLPEKGETIPIDTSNISKYKRIIGAFEGNQLKISDGKIFVNGMETSEYTFKMGYYWMMGDNRDNSADSRFWGFVPENHIVGKPKYVWLSLDKEKKFLGKIRLKRTFLKIQ